MDKIDKESFDEFAKDYDAIHKKNLGPLVKDLHSLARYKVELAKNLILINPTSILEFGCGTGRNLPFLQRVFPDSKVFAVDISSESVAIAKKENPKVQFLDSDSLKNPNNVGLVFDLVFIANVFHHIPPEERIGHLHTLRSILSDIGKIVIFEHNPYNPVTQYLVNTCDFDKDAHLLSLRTCMNLISSAALKSDITLYTLLFPWRWKTLEKAERFLGFLPLGGQYCVVCSLLNTAAR